LKSTVKIKRCYLCNSVNTRTLYPYVRDNKNIKVLQCGNCGLVFLNSRSHVTTKNYENSEMHASNESIQKWIQDSRLDDQRRFNNLKKLIKNKKIMDFGCGAGGFICQAQHFARQCFGVEPEKRVRRYYKNKIPILPSLGRIKEKFDVISAFHVVEHLADPAATIRNLMAKLKPGGILVLETPNSDDALITFYRSKRFQEFTFWSKHLFLFNHQTLLRLAKKAGCVVIRTEFVQRYPIANHLYWLFAGKPGGHLKFPFNLLLVNKMYEMLLGIFKKTDTLTVCLKKNDSR